MGAAEVVALAVDAAIGARRIDSRVWTRSVAADAGTATARTATARTTTTRGTAPSYLAGPLAKVLAALPAEAAAELRERAAASVAGYATGDGLDISGVTLLAAGRA
jgi:hypothetical protein